MLISIQRVKIDTYSYTWSDTALIAIHAVKI